MNDTYYKTLDADGNACNGGHGKWHLPTLQPDGTRKPGRWMPKVANPVCCERGYHLFEAKDVLEWANATCYVAEYRGAVDKSSNKIAVESARLLYPVPNWNDRNLRLFACRVAEDVLPIFNRAYPNDERPAKAIETARRYANGEATEAELAAAGNAAEVAARAAAWDAAWNAARAAAEAAARAAAWDAARAAAWDAARAAARAAAWDAAWNAARAAAEAAAWDAARAKYTAWLWAMVR